jgi:hypothetical protein
MAAIVILQGANLNPTSDFLPKRSGNSFVDSPLQSTTITELKCILNGVYVGLNLDQSNGYYQLGDFNNTNNGTVITINDSGQYIDLGGHITVVGGVHGASGTYLNIRVNGTSYYINLLT